MSLCALALVGVLPAGAESPPDTPYYVRHGAVGTLSVGPQLLPVVDVYPAPTPPLDEAPAARVVPPTKPPPVPQPTLTRKDYRIDQSKIRCPSWASFARASAPSLTGAAVSAFAR